MTKNEFESLKKAWDEMLQGSEPESLYLRKTIRDSWIRSRNYRINPETPKLDCLSADKLKKLRTQDYLELLNCAHPFMKSLYEYVTGSGYVVLLADKNGFLIESIGGKGTLKNASDISLNLGVNWTEKFMGTTSIGTCLSQKKPVQICGPEHYLRICHTWTCSAAPIRNSKKEVIAVLNMSGDYRGSHPHTLGMVVAAAKAIEHHLVIRKALNESEISRSYLMAILDAISIGLLAVDHDGFLQFINKEARNMLKIKQDIIHKKLPYEVTGKLRLEETLKGKSTTKDREVTLRLPRTTAHLSVSTHPVKFGETTIGALGTLQEIKTVRRMVHQMVGNTAAFNFENIYGRSESILEAVKLARSAAKLSLNVLLLGESGTGKEVFAQGIHNDSNRHHGPFVAINCAAVPRELIGSELFGYAEGAFTGARRQGAPGKFELADSGTIFLDEVVDMPMEQQPVLLRVLEGQRVTRLGGHEPIPVDTRVITSCNQDLGLKVSEGKFRADLYYRLNVLCIRIPPLRERSGDIEILAHHFLEKLDLGMPKRLSISQKALQVLNAHNWPGNVRELQNVILQAAFLSQGELIKKQHLQLSNDITSNTPLSLQEIERNMIQKAFEQHGGNVEAAARSLGIGRSTLYRKLKGSPSLLRQK